MTAGGGGGDGGKRRKRRAGVSLHNLHLWRESAAGAGASSSESGEGEGGMFDTSDTFGNVVQAVKFSPPKKRGEGIEEGWGTTNNEKAEENGNRACMSLRSHKTRNQARKTLSQSPSDFPARMRT
eukprot:932415-Rhodomonas_salina.3